MADNNNAADLLINFAESIVDGQTYEGPRESQGFRTLAFDGNYKVEIEEATPGQSKTGNATLNLVVRVMDKDGEGTRVFGNVTCSGFTDEEKPRPNIYNLLNLLLSAGRTKEQVDSYATGAKQMKLGDIAASLLIPGKNVAYAQIRHEVATQGNMAGKEVARVRNFILQTTFEKQNEAGARGNRWEKKLGGAAGNGATKPNGAATATMSGAQLDAAAAGI